MPSLFIRVLHLWSRGSGRQGGNFGINYSERVSRKASPAGDEQPQLCRDAAACNLLLGCWLLASFQQDTRQERSVRGKY